MLKKTLSFLLLIFTLSGCGMTAAQKLQVAQFGSATEAMGSFAETELAQVRQEVIQMNTEQVTLSSKLTYTNIDVDKPLSLESVLKRVAAAQALKSYGSLLNQLATADRTEGIKKAAGSLVEDFNSALDQGLTKTQKEAAVGLIGSLGTLWIEKAKKDAVKQIVADYKNAVDTVADLLSKDFLEKGAGYLGEYATMAGHLKNTAIGVLSRGPSFTERERAMQAYATAIKTAQKAKEIDNKAQKAIVNLKQANAKLVEVMAQDNFIAEDIKNYAKSIQELITLSKGLANK